jgi:LysM domain
MGLSDGWKKTVEDGVTNRAWDEYDPLIKEEVDAYNKKFAKTTGYVAVDWKLAKAVLWVESGGPSNSAWKKRPMQIGNPGDPGYGVLKQGKEGSDLVMSDQLKIDIKGDIDQPKLNIRAGIAYLFTKMMKSDIESVFDPTDSTIYPYTIVPGDSFYQIARKVGSTQKALQDLNPHVKLLKPKDTIKVRKARLERAIKGWQPFTTSTIASRYNIGDSDYAAKLDHVLKLFARLKR